MDNAQKAIMIGVGLFITIIIISAVLLITNLGTGLINNAQNQMSNISQALQNQVTSSYDGKTMTGADVIAACQQYENSDSISVKIVVSDTKTLQTGKYEAGLVTAVTATAPKAGGIIVKNTGADAYKTLVSTVTDSAAEVKKSTLADIQATGGVSATQTYYSYIMKDQDSDNVMGILFIRKGQTASAS